MTLSLERPQKISRYAQRDGATWDDYVALRDNEGCDWNKIAFDEGWLWIDMGKEGPNHASCRDLITLKAQRTTGPVRRIWCSTGVTIFRSGSRAALD